MAKHYVCPSCGGVSETPKECSTDGCRLQGHELVECNCADGRHDGILGAKDQPATEM